MSVCWTPLTPTGWDTELLIGQALRGRDRDRVAISVKFRAQRDPDGGFLSVDGRPAAVKTALPTP